MKRREFITALGGAAAWPLAARAQQSGPMRRVGVLMPLTETNPEALLRVVTFRESLAKLEWIEGRNVRFDIRWGATDIDLMRRFATELVGLRPDALLAGNTAGLVALGKATSTIPIVFASVSDPIALGFVHSLARPGGNVTGFLGAEPPLAGRWVQLLKQTAPALRRAAFLFNPEMAPYTGEWFRYAEAAATPLGLELSAFAVHNDAGIDDALAAVAREPDSGVLVNSDAFIGDHRHQIIALAIKHRIPTIWGSAYEARDGGLLSYGVDLREPFRQAADYIDRILRGTKPGDLPVQAATRYALVINLKTAKAIGIGVSPDMLSIADEVIE
jgi:putative ABC transport system substrate-binding protein